MPDSNQTPAGALMIRELGLHVSDEVTTMRRINLRAGTALALILPVLMAPAFMTNAAAQEKKDPRAGGAPAARVAPPAPVQHAAPPAPPPHIAAPVAATPHFTAPVQQQQVHIQQQQQQVHVQQQQQQVHIQQQPHFEQHQQHIAAPAHIARTNSRRRARLMSRHTSPPNRRAGRISPARMACMSNAGEHGREAAANPGPRPQCRAQQFSAIT